MRSLALLFFYAFAAAAALPIASSDPDKLNAILKLVPNQPALPNAGPIILSDGKEGQMSIGNQDESAPKVYGAPL